MVQTLILMRHGKAEQCAATGNDADRALTDAGRRALEAALPKTVGLFDTTAPIRIWTSPLTRARQTASLLSSFLDGEEASLHPTLAAGDLEGFLDEVHQCPDQTVVAVGHNPFVEQLTERLSGIVLPFEKGTLASFGLTPDTTSGELIWFVQGPRAMRWATLYHLEKILKRSERRVWKARRRFLKNPDDDKMLHKFRISIRTMRSLLSFAAPFQRKGWNAALQDDLRSLVRQTSRLRDLDILCARARKISEDAAGIRSDAEKVILSDAEASTTSTDPSLEAICIKMRKEERDRVVAAMNGRRLQRAARRVRRSMRGVIWRQSVEREGLGEEELQARFTALGDAFRSAYETLDFSDATATHSLRKRAKRLRYVADELSMLLDDAEVTVRQMEAIQDELGALCDARASRETIASIDRRKLPSHAAHELLMLEKQEEDYLRDALQNGGEPPHLRS